MRIFLTKMTVDISLKSNNGDCVDGIADFQCSCYAGFSGELCENDIDECQATDCNGGTCIDLVNGFECECPTGFVGEFCETNEDDCIGILCENGGTCEDLVGTFTCNCPPGFTGTFCDEDINDCTIDSCANSGICVNLNGPGYVCECTENFTGADCSEQVNFCRSRAQECLNGAECFPVLGGITCACPPSFSGDFCENTDYCYDEPCGDNGFCSNLPNGESGFICNCSPGYVGRNCEIKITPRATTSSTTTQACFESFYRFFHMNYSKWMLKAMNQSNSIQPSFRFLDKTTRKGQKSVSMFTVRKVRARVPAVP